jgi:predicted adenine nucleotide alpha hydrolase (AANH) superfamily ATPase
LKKLTVENLETDYPNPSFLEEVKGLKSLEEKDTNSALKINQIYKRYFP